MTTGLATQKKSTLSMIIVVPSQLADSDRQTDELWVALTSFRVKVTTFHLIIRLVVDTMSADDAR